LKQTGKRLGMFSQRSLVCLLVFVLGGEQSIRIKKKEFSKFWTVNLNYTVLKFSKSRTNLHLQKSNEILRSGYGKHRSARRLHESWLCRFVTCCSLQLNDDAVTLGFTLWRRLDLLVVLLEGSSIVTVSIKVTEVTSCLKS